MLNENILIENYPKQFKPRKIRGLIVLIVALILFFLWSYSFGLAIGSLITVGPEVMSIINILQMLFILGPFVLCCYVYAWALIHPDRYSLSGLRLRDAKILYDHGEFDLHRQPDPAHITIDYRNYSLFSLMNIHDHIDKESYPDNYLALLDVMRARIETLISEGVYIQYI
ncbi:MAG: hypothetical protein JW860_08265 [Sedimentisphaerales bacterium]|nr:hypothetical protein [Sedimentisphaerales bacterium]